MIEKPATEGGPDTASASADQTRSALIRAGLRLFGEKGYDAASTREIAASARSNVGSIAYHFGGKEGLRSACAEHIVETIRTLARETLARAQPEQLAGSDPESATRLLRGTLRRLMGLVNSVPEAAEMMQFILRELGRPTSALDTIYFGVFEPVHKQICTLWSVATGDDATSERTRVQVFTLVGQLVYFRIAREAVLRRMGWATVGPAEVDLITEVAVDNISAAAAARRAANAAAGRLPHRKG